MRTVPLLVLIAVIIAAGIGVFGYLNTPATKPAPFTDIVAATSTFPFPAASTTTTTAGHATGTPAKATAAASAHQLPPASYENTVLALGQTGHFYGNITVTPKYVVNDSRCPIGVFCIQFGTLSLAFDVTADGVTTHQVLPIGQSIKAGGHVITFKSVEPLKRMQTTIAPEDYRFTFSVE